MKKILNTTLALLLCISLLSNTVSASSSLNENTANSTTYPLSLSLFSPISPNSVQGKLPISENSVITLQADFSVYDDNSCSLLGNIIIDESFYPFSTEGELINSNTSINSLMYYVTGNLSDNYFTAVVSYDTENHDAFITTTIGTVSDNILPIQMDFGTLTSHLSQINTEYINKVFATQESPQSAYEPAALTNVLEDSTVIHRRTQYFDNDVAAVSLYTPVDFYGGVNNSIYAKVSADYDVVLDLAQEMDPNASTVVKPYQCTITMSSNHNRFKIMSSNPTPSTESISIPIPIYTGGLNGSLSAVSDYSIYWYTITISSITRTPTDFTGGPNSTSTTFNCGDLKFTNINMNGQTPHETRNAFAVENVVSVVNGTGNSITFTATANLTMAYIAYTSSADGGVFKTLPLGSKDATYTQPLLYY